MYFFLQVLKNLFFFSVALTHVCLVFVFLSPCFFICKQTKTNSVFSAFFLIFLIVYVGVALFIFALVNAPSFRDSVVTGQYFAKLSFQPAFIAYYGRSVPSGKFDSLCFFYCVYLFPYPCLFLSFWLPVFLHAHCHFNSYFRFICSSAGGHHFRHRRLVAIGEIVAIYAYMYAVSRLYCSFRFHS